MAKVCRRGVVRGLRAAAVGTLVLAAALLHPGGATLGLAQDVVAVLPVQGLRFGMLIPGLSTVVSPQDAQGRGVLEFRGSGSVTVTFDLPDAMVLESGALLPLSFGPVDGRIVFSRGSRVIEFDPRQPVTFHIPPGQGEATVYLGGTAQPTPRQPPGRYAGSITARVVISNSRV